MKLSLTLFLILLAFMSPIPDTSSCLSWVGNWDKKLLHPEEQHPLETECQPSSWLSWLGLTTCPTKIEDGNKGHVLHDQHGPTDTKSQPSNWLCWFGLTTCPTKMEDEKKNQVLHEEQHPTESKSQPSNWLCWFGLPTCPTKKDQVLPKEQRPVKSKSQPSYWLCRLGLTSCSTNIEDRKKDQVLHEEQRLVKSKSQPSYWLCRLGLTSCSTKTEDGKKNKVFHEEQSPVETKGQHSNWLCWIGLNTCPQNGDKNVVRPEKRLSVKAECRASIWPFCIHLSPDGSQNRVSESVDQEGPKQQSPRTQQKAFSVPDTLSKLWGFLNQHPATWIVLDFVKDWCMFRLGNLAFQFCRDLWRR